VGVAWSLGGGRTAQVRPHWIDRGGVSSSKDEVSTICAIENLGDQPNWKRWWRYGIVKARDTKRGQSRTSNSQRLRMRRLGKVASTAVLGATERGKKQNHRKSQKRPQKAHSGSVPDGRISRADQKKKGGGGKERKGEICRCGGKRGHAAHDCLRVLRGMCGARWW